MFDAFTNFADFSGRAGRSEYWLFQLLNVVVLGVGLFATLIGTTGGGGPLMFGIVILAFWLLVATIPQISVTVRRLHDHDLSGWWYLAFIVTGAIPIINFLSALAFLYVFARAGTPGPNRFGPDPVNPWRGVSAYF